MREPIVPKSVPSRIMRFIRTRQERRYFYRKNKIDAWLLDRRGLPICEFVECVRAAFCDADRFRARRPKDHDQIAAAYPDSRSGAKRVSWCSNCPTAQVKLRSRFRIRKNRRTIFVRRFWGLSFAFLGRIGLTRVEQFLVTSLAQFFVRTGKTCDLDHVAFDRAEARADLPSNHQAFQTSRMIPVK